MFLRQTLVFYTIYHLIACRVTEGYHGNNIRNHNRQLRNIYASDLKVKELDWDKRQIHFTWKGGDNYELRCYTVKSTFDSYKTYQNSGSPLSPSQRGFWSYHHSYTDYYCAIITFDKWRSNIVKVTTPVSKRVMIGSTGFSIIIFLLLAAICIRLCCIRRRRSVINVIVREPASRTQPLIATQSNPYPPPYGAVQKYCYNAGQVQDPPPPYSAQGQFQNPSQPFIQQNAINDFKNASQ